VSDEDVKYSSSWAGFSGTDKADVLDEVCGRLIGLTGGTARTPSKAHRTATTLLRSTLIWYCYGKRNDTKEAITSTGGTIDK
jgi:hypothetical protein